MPSKIVNIVRMLYHDCQGICGNKLTEPFTIQIGVKQGCILPQFLFSLCINWFMKNAAKDQRDIQWTLSNMLSDLNFADEICLLAHRHTDMQAMTVDLASAAAMLGLKVSTKKTKHRRMNHCSDAPIIPKR